MAQAAGEDARRVAGRVIDRQMKIFNYRHALGLTRPQYSNNPFRRLAQMAGVAPVRRKTHLPPGVSVRKSRILAGVVRGAQKLYGEKPRRSRAQRNEDALLFGRVVANQRWHPTKDAKHRKRVQKSASDLANARWHTKGDGGEKKKKKKKKKKVTFASAPGKR